MTAGLVDIKSLRVMGLVPPSLKMITGLKLFQVFPIILVGN